MRINYTKIINFRLSLALQPKFLLGGPPKGKNYGPFHGCGSVLMSSIGNLWISNRFPEEGVVYYAR